jgi:hypothetical protein
MEKPWNLIYDRCWFASSNHKNGDSKLLSNSDGMIIIQDCNQAGEFFRIIYWINEDRYMYVTSDSNWTFNKSLNLMDLNTEVIELQNNKKFQVTLSQEYYKVLVPLNTLY